MSKLGGGGGGGGGGGSAFMNWGVANYYIIVFILNTSGIGCYNYLVY